ncbi:MAG: c-type cytochrome [Betaproteobacteria bacterium]|nr:c-type cytochrome [Betaproteobacteria bacterium]
MPRKTRIHAATALCMLSALGTSALAEPGPLASYDPPLDPAFAKLIASADLDAGARYFDRKCAQCHDGHKSGSNFKGPHLWNVMGRMAATREGFEFSPAMKAVKKKWTYATLNYFLEETARAVPEREMNLVGITDDATRANLIAYLRTLGDAPAALP